MRTLGSLSLPGTEAYDLFNDKLDAQGVLSYGNSAVQLSFSHLDPELLYNVILFGNRNQIAYTQRMTQVTISGADEFLNESSPETDFAGPLDDTILVGNGYNTENGFVAKFTQIRSGEDGAFEITLSDGGSPNPPKHYLNAMILEAVNAGPAFDSGNL